MLKIYKFDSGVEGSNLLLLGGIHGNEVCGVHALTELVQELERGTLSLQKGSVTIVPMCNPKAYEMNVRFVDRNLNRYMSPIDVPKLYEDDLTNALCPLLEDADILLDIHSYHQAGVPFAYILSPDSPEARFATSIGVEHMVYGFENAYQNVGDKTQEDSLKESMGTTEYMRQFGGFGFTLECGGHHDPQSTIVAKQSAMNALRYCGIIDGKLKETNFCNVVEISKVFYGEKGCRFAQDWKNFMSIPSGDVIGAYSDGRDIKAPFDCCIVQPWLDVPEGLEWFYLGRKVC